jgi:ABC-type multidrug transport system fused ATPase/permease subunit
MISSVPSKEEIKSTLPNTGNCITELSAPKTITSNTQLLSGLSSPTSVTRAPDAVLVQPGLPVTYDPDCVSEKRIRPRSRLATVIEEQMNRMMGPAVREVMVEMLSSTKNLSATRFAYVGLSSLALICTTYISSSLIAPGTDFSARAGTGMLLIGPVACWYFRRFLGIRTVDPAEPPMITDLEKEAGEKFGNGNKTELSSSPITLNSAFDPVVEKSTEPSPHMVAITKAVALVGGISYLTSVYAAGVAAFLSDHSWVPLLVVAGASGVCAERVSRCGLRSAMSQAAGVGRFFWWGAPVLVASAAVSLAASTATPVVLEAFSKAINLPRQWAEIGVMLGLSGGCLAVLYHYQKQANKLATLHGTELEMYLTHSWVYAVADINPDAQRNPTISQEISEAKRGSFNLRDLIKKSFEVSVTLGSSTITVLTVLLSGHWETAVVVAPVAWILLGSAVRRANRTIAVDEDLAGQQHTQNYLANDLASSLTLTRLWAAGRIAIGKLIEPSLALMRYIAKHRLITQLDNIEDSSRASFIADAVLMVPFAYLVVAAHAEWIPFATAGWLAASLFTIQRDLKLTSDKLSEVLSWKRHILIRRRVKGFSEVLKKDKEEIDRLPSAPEILLEGVKFSFKEPPDGAPDAHQKWQVNIAGRLVIRPGSVVGVVGKNGSGKSTLMKIIQGVCPPTEGKVSVGGFDLEHYRIAGGHYMQDTKPLLGRTIGENMGFSMTQDNPPDPDEVLREFGVREVVLQGKPRGVDTIIGPNLRDRAALSGGQASMAELAGIAGSAQPSVTLDEVTAAVDEFHLSTIREKILAWHGSRTTLLVSHRVRDVEHCDAIIFMKNGCISAIGTHPFLLQHSLDYQAMFAEKAVKSKVAIKPGDEIMARRRRKSSEAATKRLRENAKKAQRQARARR